MKISPITTAMAILSIGISIVIVGTAAMIENPDFVHSLPTGINELLGIETAEQKSMPVQPQVVIDPILFCQDTDNASIMVTGITSVADQTTGVITSNVDYCENSATLIEYSCSATLSKSQLTSARVTCPYGCLNGRCLKQSDRGVVYISTAIDTEAKAVNPSSATPTLSISDFQAGGEVEKMMGSDFRNQYIDSFGGKIKISWFLQTQEMFCHTIPANCTVVNDLMKTYGPQIASNGDYIAWHSHFDDYASHIYPKPWWDQITTFNGTQYTHGTDQQLMEKALATIMIDQKVFPSIYKSGWAWENTDVSNWLENVMPYDYSNISPIKNLYSYDPYENMYDWSRASQAWTPYHPSTTDYQVAGSMKRSIFRCIPSSGSPLVIYAFQQAVSNGMTSACFTTHSFSQPTKNLTYAADIKAAQNAYPTIKYKYVTSLEAAQAMQGYNDTTPPTLFITNAGKAFLISSDEPIFGYPYAAVKTKDGQYIRVQPMSATAKAVPDDGEFHWVFNLENVSYAQVVFGASDYAGNTFLSDVFTPKQ